jgi:hypothetical protein
VSLLSLNVFDICPILEDRVTEVALLSVPVTATLKVCQPCRKVGSLSHPHPHHPGKRKHTDCKLKLGEIQARVIFIYLDLM